MSGLIQTGEDYKNKALSGFIRQSAEQQRIDQSNADREAQQKAQTVSMITSGIGAAASIGLMIAMCA